MGIDFGVVAPPVSEQEAQRGQKWCSHILWLAAVSDKVYQLLAHSRRFSPGTPASSTTKTGRHDIAEILLKLTLKHQKSINHFMM
jgi:hypothetical protein